MEKNFVMILLVFIPILCLAQSREVKSTLEFKIKNRKYLKNADGWSLNKETREWVKNENFIYHEKLDFIPSFIYNNIDSIWFDKIVYKNDTLFGMFAYKTTGYYKYPSIQEDWITVNELRYTLFLKEDYKVLNKVFSQHSEEVFLIPTFFSGKITDKFDELTERRLLIEIEENLDKDLPKLTEIRNNWETTKSIRKKYKNDYGKYFEDESYLLSIYYFPITNQVVDEKEVVRFEYLTGKYSMEDVLKERYFEVPSKQFSQLLIE